MSHAGVRVRVRARVPSSDCPSSDCPKHAVATMPSLRSLAAPLRSILSGQGASLGHSAWCWEALRRRATPSSLDRQPVPAAQRLIASAAAPDAVPQPGPFASASSRAGGDSRAGEQSGTPGEEASTSGAASTSTQLNTGFRRNQNDRSGRTVGEGIVHVQNTFNNIILTLTDVQVHG